VDLVAHHVVQDRIEDELLAADVDAREQALEGRSPP
jgi:hypothetical protein